jgi:hypothetical protein
MNNQDKKLTSDEMFREAQQQYLDDINRPLIRSANNELIITAKNIEIISGLYQQLKEVFFCGQGGAAYYLSQFYYNGWSVEKDDIKGDFILSIGKKCGDQHCMVSDYKSDNPLPEKLRILAVKCTEVIISSKSKYESEITDAIKKEAESAIIECIKDTEIKDIFGIIDNTSQNISSTPQLLTQADTTSELSGPLDNPKKNDNLSVLMLLSKVNEPTKDNYTDNKQQPPLITPTILVQFQQTEFNTTQQIETPVLGADIENNNNCFVKKCLIL